MHLDERCPDGAMHLVHDVPSTLDISSQPPVLGVHEPQHLRLHQPQTGETGLRWDSSLDTSIIQYGPWLPRADVAMQGCLICLH